MDFEPGHGYISGTGTGGCSRCKADIWTGPHCNERVPHPPYVEWVLLARPVFLTPVMRLTNFKETLLCLPRHPSAKVQYHWTRYVFLFLKSFFFSYISFEIGYSGKGGMSFAT